MRYSNKKKLISLGRMFFLLTLSGALLFTGCSAGRDQVIQSIRNSARAEDMERAEDIAMDYMETHGQDPEIYLTLSDCYAMAGNEEKAARMYEITQSLLYPEWESSQETPAPSSEPKIYQDGTTLSIRNDPRLEGVFPTGEEYQIEGIPIGQYTPEELWAWAPRADSPQDHYESKDENGWWLQEKFQNLVIQVNWAREMGLSGPWQMEVMTSYNAASFNGSESAQVLEFEGILPRDIQPQDSPSVMLEKMGLTEDLALIGSEYNDFCVSLKPEGAELKAVIEPDSSEQTFRFVYEEGWGDFQGESRFYYQNGQLDSFTITCNVGYGPAN